MGVSGVNGVNFRDHVSNQIEGCKKQKFRELSVKDKILAPGRAAKSMFESAYNADTSTNRASIYKALKPLCDQTPPYPSDDNLLIEYFHSYGTIVFGVNGTSGSTLYTAMTKTISEIAKDRFQLVVTNEETNKKIISELFISKLKLEYENNSALKVYAPLKSFISIIISEAQDAILDKVQPSMSRRVIAAIPTSGPLQVESSDSGDIAAALGNKSTETNRIFSLIDASCVSNRISALPINTLVALAILVSEKAITSIREKAESLKNKRQPSEKADEINTSFKSALEEALKKILDHDRDEKQS
jgi:hypothetical protein